MTIIKSLWASVQGDADRAGATTPTSSGNTELRRRIDDLATRIADLQNHLESNPT